MHLRGLARAGCPHVCAASNARLKAQHRLKQLLHLEMFRIRFVTSAVCNRLSRFSRCAFSTNSVSNTDLEHCHDLLKSHDLERSYLQLAFVPSEFRFEQKMCSFENRV